jgi:hypothetical protein
MGKGRIKYRGVVKCGKIFLLDNVSIENGSLVDVSVFKSGTEIFQEKALSDRGCKSTSSVPFSLKGKNWRDDPVLVFQDLPKSPTAMIRFQEFVVEPNIEFASVMSALVEHAIASTKPNPDVVKQLKRILRKRIRMEFRPGTQVARSYRHELFQLLERQQVEDENPLSVWLLCAAAITGGNNEIAVLLREYSGFRAEIDVIRRFQTSSGHNEQDFRAKSVRAHEERLRCILCRKIVESVRRMKRCNDPAGSKDMFQRECKELVEHFSQLANSSDSKP